MKTNLISALIFLVASICGYSQVWQQTASTPEGSGVTEIVVRQINGHNFVTTGSFNWLKSCDCQTIIRVCNLIIY